MFWFYFACIIPISIGLTLFLLHKRVNWVEWIIGSILALIIALSFHVWAYHSQIGDWEIHSGQIIEVKQFSAWREQYEEAIYRTETYQSGTDGNGNPTYSTRQVFSHYETRRRWHEEYWKAYSNINTEHSIDKKFYQELCLRFGGFVPVKGIRKTSETSSKMIDGDPNDYVATNKTGWIEPVNKSIYFENRVKATKNIFNRESISNKDANKLKLFEYPYYVGPWVSNRLMGNAQKYITFQNWEKLNGKLGPIKRINLICVGFESHDSSIAEKQMAYWKTPKKNDLIIMFGKNWAQVYSFSDSELCKQNIQTLFLHPENPNLLNDLEKEIIKNYQLVKWDKFKYLSISPQTHHIVWFLIVLFLTQTGLYIYFHNNEY
jgi:hypothetical protein